MQCTFRMSVVAARAGSASSTTSCTEGSHVTCYDEPKLTAASRIAENEQHKQGLKYIVIIS